MHKCPSKANLVYAFLKIGLHHFDFHLGFRYFKRSNVLNHLEVIGKTITAYKQYDIYLLNSINVRFIICSILFLFLVLITCSN